MLSGGNLAAAQCIIHLGRVQLWRRIGKMHSSYSDPLLHTSICRVFYLTRAATLPAVLRQYFVETAALFRA